MDRILKNSIPGSSLLKAFTITELLVTMVISGLVIIAASQVMMNFKHLEVMQQEGMGKSTVKLQFYKAMKTDLNASQKIIYYDDEIILSLTNKKMVSYLFKNEQVIRTIDENVDTFNLVIAHWTFDLDQKVKSPVALNLEFNDDSEEENSSIKILKHSDNDILMNKTELENTNR